MRDQKQRKAEFGDFQTPISLAREVCSLIARTGFRPASILEPTCGTGSFLKASLETFPDVSRILGFEINQQYVAQAQRAVALTFPHASIEVYQSDFFLTNWAEIVEALPEPVLVIGNPPWVTNAALSTWGSNNVPMKSNLDNLRGIDALTGKSNFDISEWMLRKNIEWLNGKNGLLAMLCKTTVARKVLLYAWQNGLRIESASVFVLDAQKYFGASVDSCLLLVRSSPTGNSKECQVFRSLHAQQPDRLFGLQDGMLVADVKSFLQWKDLTGTGFRGWRSGIKHDCSKVFELRVERGNLVNGLGEFVELESEVLFPLLKSSDLAAHRKPRRWMVVPQRTMSDDPVRLRLDAPKTWNYLTAHAHLLDKRKSSIHRNRPRFSVFGVGPYSFAPWKIAISGLYKKLGFVQVPSFRGSPVVLDDTCYFFPCQSEEECNLLYELVTSEPAREFWSALIFWDAKRPITAQLLNSLDLMVLARLLGKECDIARTLAERQIVEYTEGAYQRLLFREESADYGSEPVANELDLPAAQQALPPDATPLRFAAQVKRQPLGGCRQNGDFTLSAKSRGASNQQVARAGEYFVVAELNKRGAFAVPFADNMPKIDIIACNSDESRTVYIQVKTKRGGKTWHSSIVGSQPMSPKADETNFWVFVDLGDTSTSPCYWIVPDWWINDDIYKAHQAYLNKHGGIRPGNPDSTHHSIDESRLEQWKDRWDILGIFE